VLTVEHVHAVHQATVETTSELDQVAGLLSLGPLGVELVVPVSACTAEQVALNCG
jgi:hypothetical protein